MQRRIIILAGTALVALLGIFSFTHLTEDEKQCSRLSELPRYGSMLPAHVIVSDLHYSYSRSQRLLARATCNIDAYEDIAKSLRLNTLRYELGFSNDDVVTDVRYLPMGDRVYVGYGSLAATDARGHVRVYFVPSGTDKSGVIYLHFLR